MELENFIALRPHLFHLTARVNLPRIRRMSRLWCAARHFDAAGQAHLASERRASSVVLNVQGEPVHIRDQRPLIAANINLESTTISDVVRMLNRYVFFWPGDERGPISQGRNHFSRYSAEDCVVLRVPTRHLVHAAASVRFSRCNSGSPRQNAGQKQLRDDSTFRRPADFSETPGKVVEVVFADSVDLPWDAVTVLGITPDLLNRHTA